MNWFPVIAGAIVAFLISYGMHSLVVDGIEAKNAATLQAQIKHDTEQCNQAKEITSSVSTKYENQISFMQSELDRLRQLPATCVYVTGKASRSNGSAAKPVNASTNGIRSGFLYSFAFTAEKYRQQVIGLQEFINKTWAVNGQ